MGGKRKQNILIHDSSTKISHLQDEVALLKCQVSNLIKNSTIQRNEISSGNQIPISITTLSLAKDNTTIPTDYFDDENKKIWAWTLSKDESIYSWFSLYENQHFFKCRIFFYINDSAKEGILGTCNLNIRISDTNNNVSIIPLIFNITNKKHQNVSVNISLCDDFDSSILYFNIQRMEDTYKDKIFVNTVDFSI